MPESNGGGADALAGTAEGDTVARTRNAGKRSFTVYEQVKKATVTYQDGKESREFDGAVLLVLAGDVEARTGEEACWTVAESELRHRAEGDRPPVLRARNNKSDGFTEAKPYALERVVRRRIA